MARKRKGEEKHANHERWLVSYADFITVLMIFFIVMYSMSKVDTVKYQQVAASLNAALGGGSGQNIIGTTQPNITEGKVTPIPEAVQMEEAKQQTDEYIKEAGLSGKVGTNIEERGLVISLQDTLIFGSGSATIEPNQRAILNKLGNILKDMPNYIRVEGHTDNVPIKNSTFSSNWQLASVRASNIVEVLINDSKLSPSKMSAGGYGENRPVADNATAEGKSKNRRVDIVILNSKYNEAENNSGAKVDTNVTTEVKK